MPLDEASSRRDALCREPAAGSEGTSTDAAFRRDFSGRSIVNVARVIAGIERYGRKHEGHAELIRADMARASDGSRLLRRIRNCRTAYSGRRASSNERRAALTFVCEVPTIIEQRLFELARAIGRELPS
jgi:hypothetical protein